MYKNTICQTIKTQQPHHKFHTNCTETLSVLHKVYKNTIYQTIKTHQPHHKFHTNCTETLSFEQWKHNHHHTINFTQTGQFTHPPILSALFLTLSVSRFLVPDFPLLGPVPCLSSVTLHKPSLDCFKFNLDIFFLSKTTDLSGFLLCAGIFLSLCLLSVHVVRKLSFVQSIYIYTHVCGCVRVGGCVMCLE